jgi:hypothetical protein
MRSAPFLICEALGSARGRSSLNGRPSVSYTRTNDGSSPVDPAARAPRLSALSGDQGAHVSWPTLTQAHELNGCANDIGAFDSEAD